MTLEEARAELAGVDGVLVPGGFGSRGWEGKILACRVAREDEIPYLGICLGMHVAVSEFARHVCGLDGANSTEMDPETPYPGDRPAARAEGGRGSRRHDAPRRAGRRARRGDAHARGVRRRAGDRRAPPPPLRGQQRLPPAARRRAGSSSAARSRRAGSSRSSSCPTTRGSSRRSSTPSSSRARRGRRRSSASSSRRRCSARVSAPASRRLRARSLAVPEVLDLFTELAAVPSPPGEERAVADLVVRYLRDCGLAVDEDGVRAGDRLDDGEPLRAPRADRRRGAALPLRAPRHGAADRGDRARRRGRCRAERGRDDPRRRRQGRRRSHARGGAARARRGTAARGHRAALHAEGRGGARRRVRLRPHAARRADRATSTTRPRRSAS